MKLSREQELILIDLGLKAVLDKYLHIPETEVENGEVKPVKKKPGRRQLTDAEKLRLSKRMKAVWRHKKRMAAQ